MANVLRTYFEKVPTATFSKTEDGVFQNLTPIFPHLSERQLKAVVLYQSANYYVWQDESSLLQYCITYILDNQDIVQNAETATPSSAAGTSAAATYNDVIDLGFSDDDDSLFGAASIIESYASSSNNNNVGSKFTGQFKSEIISTSYDPDLPDILSPRKRLQRNSPPKDPIVITDSPDVIESSFRSHYSISSNEDTLGPTAKSQTSAADSPKKNSVSIAPDVARVIDITKSDDLPDLTCGPYVTDEARREIESDSDDGDDLPDLDDLFGDGENNSMTKSSTGSNGRIFPSTSPASTSGLVLDSCVPKPNQISPRTSFQTSSLPINESSASACSGSQMRSSAYGSPIKPGHFGASCSFTHGKGENDTESPIKPGRLGKSLSIASGESSVVSKSPIKPGRLGAVIATVKGGKSPDKKGLGPESQSVTKIHENSSLSHNNGDTFDLKDKNENQKSSSSFSSAPSTSSSSSSKSSSSTLEQKPPSTSTAAPSSALSHPTTSSNQLDTNDPAFKKMQETAKRVADYITKGGQKDLNSKTLKKALTVNQTFRELVAEKVKQIKKDSETPQKTGKIVTVGLIGSVPFPEISKETQSNVATVGTPDNGKTVSHSSSVPMVQEVDKKSKKLLVTSADGRNSYSPLDKDGIASLKAAMLGLPYKSPSSKPIGKKSQSASATATVASASASVQSPSTSGNQAKTASGYKKMEQTATMVADYLVKGGEKNVTLNSKTLKKAITVNKTFRELITEKVKQIKKEVAKMKDSGPPQQTQGPQQRDPRPYIPYNHDGPYVNDNHHPLVQPPYYNFPPQAPPYVPPPLHQYTPPVPPHFPPQFQPPHYQPPQLQPPSYQPPHSIRLPSDTTITFNYNPPHPPATNPKAPLLNTPTRPQRSHPAHTHTPFNGTPGHHSKTAAHTDPKPSSKPHTATSQTAQAGKPAPKATPGPSRPHTEQVTAAASETTSATNPPQPSNKMTVDQQLHKWKQEVVQLFPNVDPDHLDVRLRAHYGPWAVNNVCSELLEDPNYPTVQTVTVEEKKESPKVDQVNYYKEWNKIEMSYPEREEAFRLLQAEFRRVRAKDLGDVFQAFNGHYAPTYRVLETAMKEAYSKLPQTDSGAAATSRSQHSVKEITLTYADGPGTMEITSKLLKGARNSRTNSIRSLNLQKEVDFVKRKKVEQKEKEDYEMAWKLNEAQYEEDGQTIECGCCYCEYPFESMIQCLDGHLFCTNCLNNYAKESIFGSGKLSLECMTTGCGAVFPQSELTRALPREIMGQYEERQREESLNLANLEDLVRCPHCNYAAIMEVKTDKVFRCQNCLKDTCRLCKEDWKEHIGLPCEKVEKKDETKLRKQYEEKMTEAKVRTCHQCRSKFTKEEGCNRMTCTCGATMCYICRKPKIDYNHFCRHPRDPGKLCTLCKACSLWTNPDEDDKRAIEEIQKEAQEKRKEIGFTDDKVIGVVEPPAAKKARKK